MNQLERAKIAWEKACYHARLKGSGHKRKIKKDQRGYRLGEEAVIRERLRSIVRHG